MGAQERALGGGLRKLGKEPQGAREGALKRAQGGLGLGKEDGIK
jgi:hypothetical protein